MEVSGKNLPLIYDGGNNTPSNQGLMVDPNGNLYWDNGQSINISSIKVTSSPVAFASSLTYF